MVGAGPTGLTAALLLARHGVRSLVVERRPSPYALPRAVHVDDEVMRVLQHAGVAEALRPLTRPALGLRLLDAGHRTMAEFTRAPGDGVHGYPQANMLDQPDLERLLRERVAGEPLVELRTSCEVVALARLRSPLVRLRRAGHEVEVEAGAVLACDGAGSPVRAMIGASLTELGRPDRWLVVDLRTARDLGTWDGVHQVCDPARASTFMQVGRDRYRFEARLRRGEQPATLLAPAALARLLAPWTGTLTGVEVVKAADYTYRACVADTWSRGRVLLLGDAAHQTPPFVGQGMGLGVRDAANASWKLAAVLQAGASERLLETYQAEREPHARALLRTAQLVGVAMTGGEGGAAAVRAGALAAVRRLPRVSERVLDRGSPPLRPGALVARRLPGRPAGHLLPQPVRDDVLGTGWAVVGDGLDEVAARLGAAVVPAGPWAGWLREHRARAVLVRPDRVVLAGTDRAGRLRGPDRAAVERATVLLGR